MILAYVVILVIIVINILVLLLYSGIINPMLFSAQPAKPAKPAKPVKPAKPSRDVANPPIPVETSILVQKNLTFAPRSPQPQQQQPQPQQQPPLTGPGGAKVYSSNPGYKAGQLGWTWQKFATLTKGLANDPTAMQQFAIAQFQSGQNPNIDGWQMMATNYGGGGSSRPALAFNGQVVPDDGRTIPLAGQILKDVFGAYAQSVTAST